MAKEEKDLFGGAFDDLLEDNPQQEAPAKKEAPKVDFDDNTQELTSKLAVEPDIFGETVTDQDAPKEYTDLKQVSHVAPDTAKPAAHGKTFGASDPWGDTPVAPAKPEPVKTEVKKGKEEAKMAKTNDMTTLTVSVDLKPGLVNLLGKDEIEKLWTAKVEKAKEEFMTGIKNSAESKLF